MQILSNQPMESGQPSFTRPPSDYIDGVVLVANTNVNYSLAAAIAAGAKFCILSAIGNFFARPGGVATVPTGAEVAGAASEANPTAFNIIGQTAIGFIATAATTITLSFYK